MTDAEFVAHTVHHLDSLDDDKEADHAIADAVLLVAVSRQFPEIAAAYERLKVRHHGFWYA
ncbi:MAG TPA: hypothetical protein VJL07_02755 [Dehalococcoidia bacterium]|nr:hypothetical protein [Dehalococcoidia bacterium]